MDARFDTKEEQIDGLRVLSTPITALRASALLAKLGKHITPVLKGISPAFVAAQDAAKGKDAKVKAGAMVKALLESDIDQLSDALQSAFATLAAGEMEQLIRDMLVSTVAIENGETKYDLSRDADIIRAFTGRTLTMFRVCGFALKATFADFFSAVSGLKRADKPATETASPSS